MNAIKSCHRPYEVVAGRTLSKKGRILENIHLEEGGLVNYWLRYDSDKRKKFKYRIEAISYDYCPKCNNGWHYADTTYSDKKTVLNKTANYLMHNAVLKKKLQNSLHIHFYWELRQKIKRHLEDWDGEGNVRGSHRHKNGFPNIYSINSWLRNEDFKYKVQLHNGAGSWWNGLSYRGRNNRILLRFFDNHGTHFSTFKLTDEEVWLKTDKDLLYFREHFKSDRKYILEEMRIFKAVGWNNISELVLNK